MTLTNDDKQARLTEELQLIQLMPPYIGIFPSGIDNTESSNKKINLLDDIAMAIATAVHNRVGVVMEERNDAVHFTLAVNGSPSSDDREAAERFFKALLQQEGDFALHMLDIMRSYAMPRITSLAGQVAESIGQFLRADLIRCVANDDSARHDEEIPGFKFLADKLPELRGTSVLEALSFLFKRLQERAAAVHRSASDPAFPAHDASLVNGVLFLAYQLAKAPIFGRILVDRNTRPPSVHFVGRCRYTIAMLGRYWGCLERLRTLVKLTRRNITYEWCPDDVEGIVNDQPIAMRRSALQVIKAVSDWGRRTVMSVSDSAFNRLCLQYKDTVTVSTHPAIRLILKAGTNAESGQSRLVGCSGGVCWTCSEWIALYNSTVHQDNQWRIGPSLLEVDTTFALTHRYPFEEDVYESAKDFKAMTLHNWLDPNPRDY
ncbi:hypothetical protein GLOTRDRAFT_121563 [Gloeophyllum trabeum ATCC 11539]|uniref:Uncharacterized protein n=1 Tax=Gloeophyllum trabeum (strain ATCC 11539 / FP-39264 / Madison 617) TaxID=670483 RepID=S7RRB2_GLOTA|nr:uncharacterized protein GLOTRDRAFT_121563 [Gloeophyllum trabeum ATCC 11539]EPQ55469.1 hypothetical protein GLOTRDRAFT_121563 [Gloeophyllum trabeum ATCC 11539]